MTRKKDGIKQVAVEMEAKVADKDTQRLQRERKEKEKDSVNDKNKEVLKLSDETIDKNGAEKDETEQKTDETIHNSSDQITKNVAISKEFYDYDDAFSAFTFAMPSRMLPIDNDR